MFGKCRKAAAIAALVMMAAGAFAFPSRAEEAGEEPPAAHGAVTSVEEVSEVTEEVPPSEEEESGEKETEEEPSAGPSEKDPEGETPPSPEDVIAPAPLVNEEEEKAIEEAGETALEEGMEELLESAPLKGFVTEGEKTFYYLENGKKATGWQTINGNRYYFDVEGAMLKGIQGLRASARNGQKVKYYFNDEGIMQTGWQTVDGYTFYFRTEKEATKNYDAGAYMFGRQVIGGEIFYFGGEKVSGALRTGLVRYPYRNDCYTLCYFYKTKTKNHSIGAAARNKWITRNGLSYYFDNDGYSCSGWKKMKDGWHYFTTYGYTAKGWWFIDGKWYFFNNSGVRVTGTKKIDGKKYRFDSAGRNTKYKDFNSAPSKLLGAYAGNLSSYKSHDANYKGQLVSDDLSLNVSMMYVGAGDPRNQAYVNKDTQCAYMPFGDQILIGDHYYDGFMTLWNARKGQVIYLFEDGVKTAYKCVKAGKGYNIGSTLLDANKNDIIKMNRNGICLYTCQFKTSAVKEDIVYAFYQKK